MIHTYSGETIQFEVNYKKRTSIGVYIDAYGNVEVQAPKGTSDEKVILLIEGNWDQILQKVKEKKERLLGPKERLYHHGESFLYLGNTYPIQISQDQMIKQNHVVFEEGTLQIFVKQLEDEKIKQALKRFYYQQCKALWRRASETINVILR